ncbi:hypothetical protein KIN20_017408 [Parelaphostrongylus tenuis]|uniref:Uncharacterized protein n=1 Tax=Parelaphostrongylus tenuis TaxID=148309 RepID=A0AAD5MN79_PARTN|nr:hypothetical protein KIN20_017408 [Parelaphostrongylus tenuis]
MSSKRKVRRSRSGSRPTKSRHSHGFRGRSPSLEHLDVSAPLSSLITNHEALAAAAVGFVGWENVKSMLPPCLQAILETAKKLCIGICTEKNIVKMDRKSVRDGSIKCQNEDMYGRSKDDVILLVADEVDCMSRRRISRILEGETALSDSSSSEESGDESGSYVNLERQQHNLLESYEQVPLESSGSPVHHSSRSSHSEVDDNKGEREYCSDIELVEGLDEEVDSLPDVSRT